MKTSPKPKEKKILLVGDVIQNLNNINGYWPQQDVQKVVNDANEIMPKLNPYGQMCLRNALRGRR